MKCPKCGNEPVLCTYKTDGNLIVFCNAQDGCSWSHIVTQSDIDRMFAESKKPENKYCNCGCSTVFPMSNTCAGCGKLKEPYKKPSEKPKEKVFCSECENWINPSYGGAFPSGCRKAKEIDTWYGPKQGRESAQHKNADNDCQDYVAKGK